MGDSGEHTGTGVVQYQAGFGRYEVDFDPYHSSVRPTITAAGGLVYEAGSLLPTRPVQDSFALVRGGQPKSSFKARKGNPDSTGKGHYQAGGENVYHYEIHPPQPTVWDATTQGPRPSAGPVLKDPIVIVDP